MRDGLMSLFGRDQRIVGVEFAGRYSVNKPKNYDAFVGAVEMNVVINDVIVKGKFMYWDLSQILNDNTKLQWYLYVTHGMSGGWTLEQAKHPAMIVTLVTGQKVTLNDPRHFATVHIISPFDDVTPEKQLVKKLKTLGPDILDGVGDDIQGAIKRFKRKKHLNICQALMDQSIVSGIGNYIKAEALWSAKISPHRSVEDLTDDELKNLIAKAITISYLSYCAGGATLRSYSDINGDAGKAQFDLKCYGRTFDVNGEEVVKEETLDKRTTWWVPSRQK